MAAGSYRKTPDLIRPRPGFPEVVPSTPKTMCLLSAPVLTERQVYEGVTRLVTTGTGPVLSILSISWCVDGVGCSLKKPPKMYTGS